MVFIHFSHSFFFYCKKTPYFFTLKTDFLRKTSNFPLFFSCLNVKSVHFISDLPLFLHHFQRVQCRFHAFCVSIRRKNLFLPKSPTPTRIFSAFSNAFPASSHNHHILTLDNINYPSTIHTRSLHWSCEADRILLDIFVIFFEQKIATQSNNTQSSAV